MQSKGASHAKIEMPHAHFDDPRQVVDDPVLSKQEKMEALETLEQDARLLETATEEGMMGGERSKLRAILSAKKALGNSTDATSNPLPDSEAEVAKEVEIEKLDP